MEDFKNRKELPREALEELFQKTLTIWNNLEFDIYKWRPQWPNLNGTKVRELAAISFCSSVLDTTVIDLELDFGYDYFRAGFGATKDHDSVELMFVDFLLMYLADELGYEFIEFTEAASSFGEEIKNV